ncbi:F-box/kelch-repeat protein At3g23880-like [Euphorbia lathyris]|uniref:F-box/kelch-repeat protein At3g23880-like n=1 Tax=Euphorbia lathyris TaxID=212925 RepID=UPI0033138EAA
MDGKRRNIEQEATVEFLPEEILTEILLRLPVKSLLISKTVCKYWHSIINCTGFVKKHLLARAAGYNQHKKFLGPVFPDKKNASYSCLLYREDYDGTVHAEAFNFPYKLFFSHEKVIPVSLSNSCDGLICFVRDQRILLWNPSIPTDYKIIQSPLISNVDIVRMGYDATSDDYKIIKVSSECHIDEDYISFEIFSLKSSSWKSKRIAKKNSVYYYTSRFIYAKNGLHWIATLFNEEEDEYTDCIIYFDLAEESLDYLNLPSNSLDCSAVMNFKESIAITGENSESQQELWVLKDHCGLKSVWNQISCSDFISPVLSVFFSFTSNGETLVQRGNDSLKDSYYSLPASPYFESLLSPRMLQ